jgi:hypothetical protein
MLNPLKGTCLYIYSTVLFGESSFRTWLWTCGILLLRPVFNTLNTLEAIIRILCVYCNNRTLLSFIASLISSWKLKFCLIYWPKNNFQLQVINPKKKRARRLGSFSLLSYAESQGAYFPWNPRVCYFHFIFSLTFHYICITQFRFQLYTMLSDVFL